MSYQLALSGSPQTAEMVALTVGSTTGTAHALTISNGRVTVDISERPMFIRVDAIE
jgi:hypothetical protein